MALRRSADRARRSLAKKVVAATLGGAITLVGVALLVLPGPGFLLVAAGLAVLATEFHWAREPLRRARVRAEHGIDEIVRSRWRTAVAVVCGLVPLSTGALHLAGVALLLVGPFLNAVTAASLVVSGLFLVGLVVYARRRGGIRDGRSEEPEGPGAPERVGSDAA